MITIYDLLYLCCDTSMLKLLIYNFTTEKIEWEGTADELPEKYEDAEIVSFDAPECDGFICININEED